MRSRPILIMLAVGCALSLLFQNCAGDFHSAQNNISAASLPSVSPQPAPAPAPAPAPTPAPLPAPAPTGPPVNGVCGSANGSNVASAPTANLCVAGVASTISGAGPFTWLCEGQKSGSNASCSAGLIINGSCGSDNGQSVAVKPTANLCTEGTASAVTGTGPFTWTCAGIDSGTTASCSTTALPINGSCGTANGSNVSVAPVSNLCVAGSAGAVTGTGPFIWTCSGLNAGSSMTCMANLIVNGICGTANGTSASSTPATNLCAAGTASAVTSPTTTTYAWTCAGANAGSVASCSATKSPCSGTPPSTVTMKLPSGASGNWFSTAANGGDLVNLPHPTVNVSCATCHASCGSGSSNTIVGYDHSNTAFVCNYCHDPGTQVVDTKVSTGSMANYHSSTDSQVCTCCHSGVNNPNFNLPASPATTPVPATNCTGVSNWPLVFPVLNSATGFYSGGQFFQGN